MYEGLRVAVVVPAFREREHIAHVITTMPATVDHIVVVDDASPDDTFEVAVAVNDARTEVLRHERNKGVGGSIVTGHRRALELGADICVVMAGDGQMDPEQLPRLLTPLAEQGYAFAKANRFYSATSYTGMPTHRVVGNLVLTFLTKAASGYWNLVDPQNGYTAITRDCLERLPLDRLAERYEFENDQLIWLNILDARAIDVPIPARYGREVSSIKLHAVVPRLLLLLFRGFWRRVWHKYVLWSFSPVALMLFAGSLLVLLGTVVGVWAMLASVGPSEASTGTWLLAVAPTLVGIQLLVQSLVLDIQATPK
ncbi:putative glycosyltransferase [Microlunatus phosphovorus NM-1]|uniref:Putative glycosyltransferase n=1 Tax=Microlunatus phosphovorus (strain ATCC 700054 / DSM 10555 / JCM 9379 / NBRC 101784 / NCIMB 13414 / VKM Ac-1990 / NM-1) TaxID=1032480 RepID=F5XGV5_MICPN|nr:glycosyltransferase family 2 protein [Microlunatus phosphovorus]BAK35587.1 putative glycosyltransferase [Microlunatus phosphovorus NM-1]